MVRELSILTIRQVLEDHIVREEQKKIERVADMLPAKEANEYRIKKGEQIPFGAVLADRGEQLFNDLPDAVAAELIFEVVKDASDVTVEDVRIAIQKATSTELIDAVGAVLGVRGSKKGRSPAGKAQSGSRKNTAGRRK